MPFRDKLVVKQDVCVFCCRCAGRGGLGPQATLHRHKLTPTQT